MISSADFDRLQYRKPKLDDDRPKLSKIIGIDSEAYTDGTPFMLCTSLGDVILPEQIPGIFFTEKYLSSNFVVYNMKYDSGAILHHLDHATLKTLWATGKAHSNGFSYQYIPHKMLRIKMGQETVTFWDIAQFYKSSLDKAAQTYLNKKKLDIRTKKFTREYVKRYHKSIAKYCIQDATLTQELGQYLVDKLDEFGITASAIYSCASISFKYFCETSNIVTSWRFWGAHKRLLQAACDGYQGGKFEVTQRGYFPRLYEYDITSAYPYEIANLIDITDADVEYHGTYQPDAVYSFLTILIDNYDFDHLPCGPMLHGVRVYPAGIYKLTVTKAEYEYMLSIGKSMQIIDGVHLFVKRKKYPYRNTINTLFAIKDEKKGKDKMLYNTTKIIMNSFYGKTVQCIEQHDGSVIAGAGWNPIYGAVITANTRLQVTRIQNEHPDTCVAVHTDSVMMTAPLPMGEPGLGKFEYVTEGEGIVIACGMYQIGDTCAFKGFHPDPGDTWKTILARHRRKFSFPYSALRVESWIEAMAKNHEKSRINVFARFPKKISLNADSKRIWPGPMNAGDFLRISQTSLPGIHNE